jgi:hypothetical protein
LAGGEIDPALHARVDQAKYSTGLKTLRNFYVQRGGGASNRAGTEFISEVKDSSNPVRLIPFIGGASAVVATATTTRNYVFEFGDGYMRPYYNGAPVLGAQKVVSAVDTSATIEITTATNHVYTTGDEVVFEGGPSASFRASRFKITVTSTTKFTLQYLDGTNVVAADFTDVVGSWSGLIAREVITVATTITTEMLPYLRFAQSGATLYVQHPSLAPSYIDIVSDIAGVGYTWGVSITDLSSLTFSGTNPFASNKPTTVALAQQRLIYGNLVGDSASFLGSLLGNLPNSVITADFAAASTNDNEPYDHTMAGNQTQVIQHIIDLNNLVIFTKTGEWVAGGDSNGVVTPTAVSLKQHSYNGANHIQPIIVDNTALFVQAAGSIIRDLVYSDSTSGLRGSDLTIFASHLFDKYTVVDWAYQKTPNPIIWVVRSDGALLGLTYVREQQILAWHRHDSDGFFESVCSIPEGDKSEVYFCVRRTINGETKRYIEKFSDRKIDDIKDIKLMDSSLTYDGRMRGANQFVILSTAITKANPAVVTYSGSDPSNGDEVVFYDVAGMTELNANTYKVANVNTGAKTFELQDTDGNNLDSTGFTAYSVGTFGTITQTWNYTTMTLSGGTTWGYQETLTLTASSTVFDSNEVGNEIHLIQDGEIIRFTIDGYTSGNVVTGRAHKTVPVAMRSVAISEWVRAVDVLQGLNHLEGKEVSVFADGFVVANPNNSAYEVITVTDGQITLPKCYGVIHVGLPYISDIETLDIDTPNGEGIADKKVLINEVTAQCVESRSFFIGPKPPSDDDADPLEKMTQVKIRENEGYDEPNDLVTGKVKLKIQGQWNSNGRIFIRNIDPVPVTIAAIYPTGMIPFKG